MAEPPAQLPLSLFDYELPDSAIAQHPLDQRDASRLLLVHPEGRAEHLFRDIGALLHEGDVLLLNETKVVPARLSLSSEKQQTAELLVVEYGETPDAKGFAARGLAKPAKRFRDGTVWHTSSGCALTVVGRDEKGWVHLVSSTSWSDVLNTSGTLPLPPYIARPEGPSGTDRERYQSVFAVADGSVAAPTASLHFTDELLETLKAKGIRFGSLTLHVGPGTFLPVRPDHADDVRSHIMHEEWYEVPTETQRLVEEAMEEKRRIIPVGTTALRAIESWWSRGEPSGRTDMFIYPGYEFQVARGLITNFHAPKSTLMMLVSAMMGVARTRDVYREALERGFRFLSYGDAMMILNEGGA